MIVLDASCLLAIIFDKPGMDRVAACLPDAVILSVKKGMDRSLAVANYTDFELPSVPFGEDLAIVAGELRHPTRHKSLSLGDRACLALAIRENATALTADRKWADLDVGCRIELIR